MTFRTLKEYYSLTKPGIIYGNLITVTGGFLLASRGTVHFLLLLATLLGLSLVVASGCVFNNYMDRDIDAKMERTKDRALVKGSFPGQRAIVFGICLGIIGFFILALFTNILSVALAAFGFFVYVGIYSPLKTRSMYAAHVGTLAGATPPVIGYCAASGRFDAGAVILFILLVTWQMAHFFAIAIRRSDDYAAAGIPVLPLKKGVRSTKISMAMYIATFLIAAPLLAVFGYAGYIYLGTVLALGLLWLGFCIKGFGIPEDQNKAWARKMFLFSLVVIMGLFISMVVPV